jgi:hypothetical protein
MTDIVNQSRLQDHEKVKVPVAHGAKMAIIIQKLELGYLLITQDGGGRSYPFFRFFDEVINDDT